MSQVSPPAIPDNGPTPTSPLGIPPHSSSSGTNENISMMNGSLNVYIPLLSLPQRGGYNLSLGLVHKSNPYVLEQTTNISSTIDDNLDIDHIQYSDAVNTRDSTLEINLPRLQLSYEYVQDHSVYTAGVITEIYNIFCATNYQFTDWSGNKHPFENFSPCNYGSTTAVQYTLTDASDGSFYRLDTSIPTDMKVYSPDGTVYHFTGFNNPCPVSPTEFYPCQTQENYYDSRASSIVDPNGNSISITTSSSAYTLTDTLGRTISIAATEQYPAQSPTGVTYTDSNGTSQTIEITTQASSQYPATQPSLSCTYVGSIQQLPYLTPTVGGVTTSQSAPSTTTITFPASAGSGQKVYTLQFDGINRLAKIDYPAGGYTRYDYQPLGTTRVMSNVQCSVPGSQVYHKYECTSSSSGSCTEQTTTYAPTPYYDSEQNVSYNQKMIVTDPLSDQEEHDFATTNPTRTNPLETDVYVRGPGGTSTLQHTNNAYPTVAPPTGPQSGFDYNFPTAVTTTLYNPSNPSQTVSSVVNYTYETYTTLPSNPYSTALDQPTEIDTTDYNGTVTQKVSQAWEPASAFTSSPLIIDRLATRTTTDAAASISSTTSYCYDASGNSISKTVGGTGITSTTTDCNSVTGLITQYPRNAHGQVTSITDPKGYSTVIGYSDAWSTAGTCGIAANSSAYPTSVSNPLSQTTSYTYNACTGTIAAIKDPNSVTTSYTYDAIGRALCATVKDVNSVTAAKKCDFFADSAPSSITETVAQSASANVTTQTSYDGFGRVEETSLTSDPNGADLTDTTYDALGRVQSVSNPYRTTNDATYGITSYEYDALGRKTYECNPDNSSTVSNTCTPNLSYKSWLYSKNLVTLADEAGNKWQQTYDALGRLTQILEPNGSSQTATMETDYTYDALRDLKSVTQCGGACPSSSARTRSFTYNGLAQLLTASNPETGTVCYGTWISGQCKNGYDADGNLVSKTDARSVTTSYSYDKLNRITQKSYSDNVTPTSCYQYDSTLIANGIGRLSAEWTQSSSTSSCTSSSGAFTGRAIVAYDPMGRIASETQSTLATNVNGQSYTPTYTYDWTGNLLTSSSGVGPAATPITLTNAFDLAGHITSISSNLVNATHPGTLFSTQTNSAPPCPHSMTIAYAAFGGLVNAQFGNGVILNRSYDSRLRTNCEADIGTGVSGPTGGSAAVTISGTEQTQ